MAWLLQPLRILLAAGLISAPRLKRRFLASTLLLHLRWCLVGRHLRRATWCWPSTGVKNQKNSRRLELSISKNTPHGRWGQGPGSVNPRFPAGLPFPVPEILEFVAFRDSGKIFQQFSRDFPGVFPENPRTDPGNSHSLLEFSEKRPLPGKLRKKKGWEEPPMDQCQSRGKLWTNFQRHWSVRMSLKRRQRGHWSIRISPEICMDQWLSNLSEFESESSGVHQHHSIECSSLKGVPGASRLWGQKSLKKSQK